jgi:hypothetical protein
VATTILGDASALTKTASAGFSPTLGEQMWPPYL